MNRHVGCARALLLLLLHAHLPVCRTSPSITTEKKKKWMAKEWMRDNLEEKGVKQRKREIS